MNLHIEGLQLELADCRAKMHLLRQQIAQVSTTEEKLRLEALLSAHIEHYLKTINQFADGFSQRFPDAASH